MICALWALCFFGKATLRVDGKLYEIEGEWDNSLLERFPRLLRQTVLVLVQGE